MLRNVSVTIETLALYINNTISVGLNLKVEPYAIWMINGSYSHQ